MKKILVTGCNGQLGRAINKEYAGESVEIINTDVAAGDHIVACDITRSDEAGKREKAGCHHQLRGTHQRG